MPEMNRIARFFVNRSAARRADARARWIAATVPIVPHATCLELGAGNGAVAARFVDRFAPARYVATDVDPHQVEEAGRALDRRYPAGRPSSLELRAVDLLDVPFPDRSFDVVLVFVALHHTGAAHRDGSKVPRALAEIDRVLKPGGLLLYSEFLHQEAIRTWLTGHGYRLEGIARRFRLESVAARKPSDPPPAGGT